MNWKFHKSPAAKKGVSLGEWIEIGYQMILGVSRLAQGSLSEENRVVGWKRD